MHDKPKTYGGFWDNYVERFVSKRQKDAQGSTDDVPWPGEEWGTPESWRILFKELFLARIDTPPRNAIEIGPGSGKYSLMFLEAFQEARLIAADVSPVYLEVLRKRCADLIAGGRLIPALIGNKHQAIVDIANDNGIGVGELDVLFSIDAMVHVDLQYLMAYWISASALLRPGGKMIMTVADATRDGGFAKLVKDVPRLFALQGQQSDKFEWLSPQLVESVLGRLGFTVEAVEPKAVRRDYWFVATRK
jgi:predicted O-methyltransferase YrrM